MRFEVPQFIEVEAKIIGPLTWKQFVYLAGGIGVIAILYLTTSFFWVLIVGLPFGILAAGLAFHKINNRPLSVFLESAFNYLLKKKLYLWKKEEQQTIVQKSETPAPAPKVQPGVSSTKQNSISSLAHNLETRNIPKE